MGVGNVPSIERNMSDYFHFSQNIRYKENNRGSRGLTAELELEYQATVLGHNSMAWKGDGMLGLGGG